MGAAGAGGLLLLLGRFGWKGILLALALILGARYIGVCNQSGGGTTTQRTEAPAGAPASTDVGEDKLKHFASYVFDDTQEQWQKLFAASGASYTIAKMVLYRDGVESACGTTSSAVGPFYCPNDQKVYLDLSFYEELRSRFGAQGDFAQAYVIAHEMGHHVQNLRGGLGGSQSNQASVATELQADCLAGVWAKSAQQREMLEAGDLEEAINAAAAIGDDRIQQQSTGEIHPESFTHGSSAQRSKAFRQGYDGGALASCD